MWGEYVLERFCKPCGELASRHSVFHQVKPFRRGHMRDQTGPGTAHLIVLRLPGTVDAVYS